MNNPFEGKEIWFLTGSQDLYGEETLAQVAEQSQALVSLIDGADSIPVKVVWKPVLKDSDSIRRAMLDANSDDSCIGLIAWMHTFSPAKMWIRGLDALTVPLLHLHTQANVELPWSTIDMDFMNLNQAAHGDREFAYIQSRMNVQRKIVSGHPSDDTVLSEIAAWSRAAAGAAPPPPPRGASDPAASGPSPGGSRCTCGRRRPTDARRARPSPRTRVPARCDDCRGHRRAGLGRRVREDRADRS